MWGLYVSLILAPPHEPLATVKFSAPDPRYVAMRRKIESLGQGDLVSYRDVAERTLAKDPRDPLKGYDFHYSALILNARFGIKKPLDKRAFYRLAPSRDPEFIRLRVLSGIPWPPFPPENVLWTDQRGVRDLMKGYERMVARDPRDQLVAAWAGIMTAYTVKGGTAQAVKLARQAVAIRGKFPHHALLSLAYTTSVHGLTLKNRSPEQKAFFAESRKLIAKYKAARYPKIFWEYTLDGHLAEMNRIEFGSPRKR